MSKMKKLVINSEINETLDKYFDGEVDIIKNSKIETLYNEGAIDENMKKFLRKLKQEHSKAKTNASKYTIVYRLDKSLKKPATPKQLIIDDRLNGIIDEHFAGILKNISVKKLTVLESDDKITTSEFKILKKIKQTYSKLDGNIEGVIKYDLKDGVVLELKEDVPEDDPPQSPSDHPVTNSNVVAPTPDLGDPGPTYAPGSPVGSPGGEFWESDSGSLSDFLKDKNIKWTKANDIEYYDGESFGLGDTLTFVKLSDKTIGYFDFNEESPVSDDETIRHLYDKNKKKIGKISIDNDIVGSPPKRIITFEDEIVPILSSKAKNTKKTDDTNVKYISEHRKSFVNFINEGYYTEILRKTKDEELLDVYQLLIKDYLSLETPYRGLLVYHGLGTGKTASAISTAENLSEDLRIRTLLPASLEGEFIKEIKKWGKNEIDMKNTLWRLIPFTEIDKNKDTRVEIFKKYKITPKIVKRVFNKSKALVKKTIAEGFTGVRPENLAKQLNDEYKKIETDLIKAYGFWIPDESGRKYESLNEYEKIVLSEQTSEIILLKYNFIHYNPLPRIKGYEEDNLTESTDLDIQELYEYMNDDEITISLTRNGEIVQELDEQLKYNRENYNIDSPFHNEVIIIDEVHNFVRKILNNSGPSRQFYEWIINAEKIKLVFLSGTPIINRPCEIAILYNMLKGALRVYTFTINTGKDTDNITHELNKIIYDVLSPIDIFFVKKVEGQTLISFTQNTTNFVSVRNPQNGLIYTAKENDHDYDDFIKEIYRVLKELFKEDEIIPTMKQALEVEKDKEIIYNTSLNLIFNRKQKLFDLFVNNEILDLTNNEKFMEYFFDESLEVPDPKKTLLRRMLMGLTSYYPIDRQKVTTMPTIKAPVERVEVFEDYTIAKLMNIVLCPTTKIQLEKYIRSWSDEKKKEDFNRKKRIFGESDDQIKDYNIRTRQDSNIVYANDDFRYQKNGDIKSKEKREIFSELEKTKSLHFDNNLKYLSPKMYKILENINKYKNGDSPNGKALVYSQFRGDAGLEALEEVLKINGYTKYDPNALYDKRLRYTFISGQEKDSERKKNKEAFNHIDNKFGEYIQLILISESGAEGISLTCVRQVHILEPYWNNVRINQVFGRAIRLHSHDDLEPKERTVEEYIYLSVLPKGTNAREIYESIKDWDNIGEINADKFVEELSKSKNKDTKDTIDAILTIGNSIDIDIFDIMENKFKISEKITELIKTSALDCIPHSRDDKTLNEQCIRFSNSLENELSYFPGITSSELIYIDRQQIKANFHEFIKPNNHILLGENDQYYYYRNNTEDIDVRYLKENSRLMCELDQDSMEAHVFFEGKHTITDELGKYFSVYQDIYDISKYGDNILEKVFPSLDDILSCEQIAHKIKYNMNDTYFYSENKENRIRTMIKYDEKLEWTPKQFIVHEDQLYELDN